MTQKKTRDLLQGVLSSIIHNGHKLETPTVLVNQDNRPKVSDDMKKCMYVMGSHVDY